MSRKDREQMVEQYREAVEGGQVLVLSHYDGLTVAAMTELRKKIREVGGSLKVVKNTLLTLALKGNEHEALGENLAGPIAVAVHREDPPQLLKVLVDFAKANPALRFVRVSLGGKIFEGDQVVALSKLPGMRELRGQLLSVFIAAQKKFLTVLGQSQRNFLQVLEARKSDIDEAA